MADSSTPAFSALDQFPATLEGHLAFLDDVSDKVHDAAEMKRAQPENGCPDETVEEVVRDIKWNEACERVSALTSMAPDVVNLVADIFHGELSVCTVEQIDEALALLAEEPTEEEHPEVVELKEWLALDGVKGYFGRFVTTAGDWNLDVDARHQSIAFSVRQIFEGDPSEDAIRDYLFKIHGIRPSDPVDLVKLEQLLKQDAEQIRTRLPAEVVSDPPAPNKVKAKKSTERGEGRAKLIAALTKHHEYADSGCLNLEPVGNNELARQAKVSESTASAFFKKEFNGHTKYRAICADTTRLVTALKLLNQDFSPHHLFGAKPPDEDDREDEE